MSRQPQRKYEARPPAASVGLLGWVHQNLFNSPLNSILTLVILFAFIKLLPPLVNWAFIDSVWFTTSEVCKESDGACWSVVSQNLRFILFGFYPYEEHWRPIVSALILFGMFWLSCYRQFWSKKLL